MKFKPFSYPYIIWMALFIVLPLGMVLVAALKSADGAFTLTHFARFFTRDYLAVFGRSIWLAFISTVICLLLGYPAAAFLANRRLKNSSFLLVLFLLPMWMNFLLRTYAWVILLEDTPLLYTQGAVVLGMVYNFLAFMILPIHTALNKMDPHLIEAAQDLGAGPSRVFRKVTLPLSMPGVISGIVMVFMPAASTFAISGLLGGGKVMLIGDLIENQFFNARNPGFGSALSIVPMVIMLLSMRLVNGSGEALPEQNRLHKRRAER
ncbi:MAG: ABC transporter permease [Clostridia bacterium]|nr:ABC transporter permease [Clostridia bacterium]